MAPRSGADRNLPPSGGRGRQHALVIGALASWSVRRATGCTLQDVNEERVCPLQLRLLPGSARGPRAHKSFGLGFQMTADVAYPFLGAGTIGHSGAGGSQAFADPRSGLAYGYARRRYAFPGGSAPENERFVRAVHTAALRG
ncbi:hypothetical protein T45_00146 [Streptomyces turgidiscabies]|nr:hypothetical protein T45_00146 [Streptomyces turgidiscabies]